MMQLFYYYDQNPSGFAFLCKLELLLFKPHWGYQIWIWKKKPKRILVVEVKWRHRASGLLKQTLGTVQ